MELSSPVTIAIVPEKCKRDGLCARVCPARIFRFEKGEVPTVERAHDCALCGQCLAVCPAAAIAHSKLAVAALCKIEQPAPVNGVAMRAFLRQRRSVRNYHDKPIPRVLLEEIANAAGYAPTGAFGGKGWVRVVTIAQGNEVMRQVREATVRYMRKLHGLLDGVMLKTVAHFSEQARSGRTTMPDLEMRLKEWAAGRDAVTYDAPAAIFVSAGYDTTTPHEDCDGALMNMVFAAHAHGLGTCWNGWLGNAALGAHVLGHSELGALLGIPQSHKVAEAFTIGWPTVHLHSVPERETSIRWIESPEAFGPHRDKLL